MLSSLMRGVLHNECHLVVITTVHGFYFYFGIKCLPVTLPFSPRVYSGNSRNASPIHFYLQNLNFTDCIEPHQ
jgi:hypothetical protein